MSIPATEAVSTGMFGTAGDAASGTSGKADKEMFLQLLVAQMRDQGARLIDEVPRRGSRNPAIAFVHPTTMGGVLVELVQER